MSIALGLRKYNKLLSLILTVFSIIVGFSRVYVGHHYPLDIIGAYIIVFATNYIYNLKLRNKVESLYEAVEKKLVENLALKRYAIKFKIILNNISIKSIACVI